ncbi:pyridoxal-dependent decarboxylase [Streptomyces sp. NPDC006267]|uniref:pyridoxal phosphate-dependent decarboxylase family protein n=1 Tax=Streptomyces sp. NPDC006267 TaxID=3157173 RepID=UPI0033BE08F1
MHPDLAADLARLPSLLQSVREHATAFLDGVEEREVVPPFEGSRAAGLPERGSGLRAALGDFAERWEPGLSASAGPRYWGFVTGGVTPAALAGDWLTAVADQNSFSSLDGAGQELERETVAWLRDLFGLSREQEGTLVSGATMSNMVGLAVAREWLGERLGVSPAEEGAAALGAVRVLSGSPHSSVPKSLSMLGLGRRSLVLVPTLAGREAVDPVALEAALEQADGPCVVVANAGTVNSGDFDDLRAIVRLRDRYDFWLHVDAAFGGFAALSPASEYLVDGMGEADSVCVDLHKWLNVPYDSAVQFTRRQDLQVRVFRNAAAYLGPDAAARPDPAGGGVDRVHRTPENSQRLRALAAWFTLRAYGREGHREIVERCMACARSLAASIDAAPGLRMLAPVRLNVVCFTLAENPTPTRLAALSGKAAGRVFLTPTVYAGVPALRAAFSNWRTTEADVRIAFETLCESMPPDSLESSGA